MKRINFTKMQGTGNDFVVLDNRSVQLPLEKIITLAPRFCDRKYGIGADGLIALQNSDNDSDYEMIYRNSDGSDAGMCGNGGRCLALFAHKLGFNKTHTFEVHGKKYKACVDGTNVKLTFPVSVQPEFIEELHKNTIIRADSGTEHISMRVNKNSLDKENILIKEGRRLRKHSMFKPNGTNVNFFCGINRNSVRLQTYERGVENLTLACGTGALASAISWHYLQSLSDTENHFRVVTNGGTLQVSFTFNSKTKTYTNLTLTGAANFVFNGTIKI